MGAYRTRGVLTPHREDTMQNNCRDIDLDINTSAVVHTELGNGHTIRGIAHRTNYKFEEEMGVEKLAAMLRQCAHPDTWIAKESALDGEESLADTQEPLIAHSTDEWAIFLASNTAYALDRAIIDAESNKEVVSGTRSKRWGYERENVPSLRAKAKERGIKPLPSRKAELVDALMDTEVAENTPLKASRMYYDKFLLLPRNTGDEYGEMVEKLLDSARHGTLHAGSIGNTPFMSSITLYDARDLTEEEVDAICTASAWERDQMEGVEELKDKLRDMYPGSVIYALGTPRVGEDGKTCYWINIARVPLSNGKRAQIMGRYTEEEMLTGKIEEEGLEQTQL